MKKPLPGILWVLAILTTAILFALASCGTLPPSPSPAQQTLDAKSLAEQLAYARGDIADLRNAEDERIQHVLRCRPRNPR